MTSDCNTTDTHMVRRRVVAFNEIFLRPLSSNETFLGLTSETSQQTHTDLLPVFAWYCHVVKFSNGRDRLKRLSRDKVIKSSTLLYLPDLIVIQADTTTMNNWDALNCCTRRPANLANCHRQNKQLALLDAISSSPSNHGTMSTRVAISIDSRTSGESTERLST